MQIPLAPLDFSTKFSPRISPEFLAALTEDEKNKDYNPDQTCFYLQKATSENAVFLVSHERGIEQLAIAEITVPERDGCIFLKTKGSGAINLSETSLAALKLGSIKQLIEEYKIMKDRLEAVQQLIATYSPILLK